MKNDSENGIDQDTVPVPQSTESQWTYPPFSAHLDDDQWIWGRGVADCQLSFLTKSVFLDSPRDYPRRQEHFDRYLFNF